MHSTISLRQKFLDYYRSNKHKFIPPSPIFNDNDKTLLFTNAGMNQLKNVFLGEKNPNSTELMNYQICVRANDLELVGKDSYHLTTFEMLGCWSLNSYGKDVAIELAYNFLVNTLHLDSSRIYVTYFKGNKFIEEDIETKELWRKFIPNDRILADTEENNLWKMAEEGPCGVSTEIHYDLIGGRNCSDLVNKDDPSVVEIWNIVFTQYNKINNEYLPLGKTFIDTGMGLERLSMIVNNTNSIYQTDAFLYLIGYAQALCNSPLYTNSYDEFSLINISYRIFADHMRTVVNALYEGAIFDSNNRGHVLKKIFRRCLTFVYVYLNNYTAEPLMHKLLIKSMISDILIYFLKGKHDANLIQTQMIEEEKLYLGKLYNSKKMYNKYIKKLSLHETMDKLKHTCGIDQEIMNNIDKMKFTLNQKV